jgi:hypothetical protein
VVGGLVLEGTQAGDVAFLNAYTLSSFTPGAAPVGPLTGQVAWADASVGVASTFGLATNLTTYDASNQPTSFSNPAPCGTGTCNLNGSLSGSIVEAGSTALADGGVMNWGRWNAAVIVDRIAGSVTFYSPPTGVPFVVGNANTTVPTGGSFLYSFAGAPSPVNTAGTTGTFTGGAFNVSFGATQTISVATPLTMSVGGVNYSLSSCTSGCSVGGPALIHNMLLGGACSGGACSTSVPVVANASSIFVGPQAGGLAVAGNIPSPAPTVTFAAGFKR